MTKTSKIWRMTSEALLGKPNLTAVEVQRLSGIPTGEAGRLWQALGFARVETDERVFTKREVEILSFAAKLFEEQRIDPDVLTQMARATGQALARVAHMHALTVAADVEAAALSSELSASQAADRVAELAESVVRDHEGFLSYIWRRHLLAAISQTVASATNDAADHTMVIGFADLVDFTGVSRQLTERELALLVSRFEAIVYQEVPDRGGRVVKTLGDEVMFATSDARAAARTALALADACSSDEIVPEARVGLAVGPALAWEGDLYGNTVNLASRLLGVARPGTVIVSAEVAERLHEDEDLTCIELRKVDLKGIGRTRPWVLRHAAPE